MGVGRWASKGHHLVAIRDTVDGLATPPVQPAEAFIQPGLAAAPAFISPLTTQVSWKSNVNGLWSKAANWSGGVLPGATNDAVLNTLSARTITFASGTGVVNSITAGTDTLSLTGGTLTVLAGATFNSGLAVGLAELALDGSSASVAGAFNDTQGSIVLGTATSLSVSGPAVLGGGSNGDTEIDGGTLATSGTTTISSPYYYYVQAVFGGGIVWTNSGTVNDAGEIQGGDGGGPTAAFINAAGAVFDFTSDYGEIVNGSYGGGSGNGSSTFSNAGTLEKIGGNGGTSNVYSTFTNSGVVDAITGTIEFDGGGVFGGTLTGAGQIAFGNSNSSATITAGGNFTAANWLIDGASVAMGTALNYAGNLTLSNGVLTLDDTADSITGSFSQSGGLLSLNGSSLGVTGATLSGGTLYGPGTLTASGTTTFVNNGYTIGRGATLINDGTIDQSNGYALYGAAGGFSVINSLGASYNVTDGYYLDDTPNDSIFTNAGTFNVNTGSYFYVYSTFTNTGVIDAASGAIEFDGGGVFGGTLTGAGVIEFDSGNSTLSANAVYSAANLEVGGGSLTLDANATPAANSFGQYGGYVDLNGNTLSLNGAILSYGYIEGTGSLLTSGNTTIGVNNVYYLGNGVAWVNSGTVSQDYLVYTDGNASSGFDLVNAAGATYDITSDYSFGYYYNEPTTTVENAGTFAKTGGTNTSNVYAFFTNTGTASAASGILEFDSGGVFGGTLSGGGTIAFGGGASTLTANAVYSAANLEVDGGSLTLDANATPAAGSFVQDGGGVYLNGNTLSLNGANLEAGYLVGTGSLLTSGNTTIGVNNVYYLGNSVAWANSGTVTQVYYVYADPNTPNGFNLVNSAGATYDITGDYDFGYYYGQSSAPTVENAGTFAKTGGTNTTNVYAFFTNTGTVSAASGILQFDNGGVFGGTLSGAGTIAFEGGTSTLTANAVYSAANLEVDGGSLILNANATPAAGSFLEQGGDIYLNGNTLSLAGASLASGYLDGSGSLLTSGTTTLNGYSTYFIGNGVNWVNSSTVDQNGYLYTDPTYASSFNLTNAAGATYDITGDYYFGYDYGQSSAPTVENAGTFAKTGGTAVTVVFANFTSTGTVSASTAGTIQFADAGSFAGSLAGTGTILFSGSSLSFGNLTSASKLTIAIQSASVEVTANTSIAGPFSTYNSNFGLSSGATLALSGAKTFSNNSYYQTVSFDGAGTVSTSGSTSIIDYSAGYTSLDIGGGATWTNSGTVADAGLIQLGDGSGSGTLINLAGAVYDLTTDDASIDQGTYVNGFGQTLPSNAAITNAGLFAKNGGSLTSHVYGTFVNTGTISATTSGTLEFDNGGTVSGLVADNSHIALVGAGFSEGNLTIGGGGTFKDSVTVDATGTLTLGDASTKAAGFSNSGIYEIDGNGGIVAGSTVGDLFTNTGLLEKISGTGRSLISANVSNNGTIEAGSGTLALTGTLSGTGKLLIGAASTLELGAAVAATQSVTFTAASGTLALDTVSGAHGTITNFVVGTTIDLVNTTATSGTLSGTNLVIYNGSSVVTTLALAGTHTGDTYSFGSDGHGGTLLGIATNATAWKGVSNDWTSTTAWTAGVPGAQTSATFGGTAKDILTIGASETDATSTLVLSDSAGTTNINGLLNIGKSLTVQAGTLNLAGTLNGGTVILSGGSTNFNGGTLENLALQGAVNLTGAFQSLYLNNLLSLTGTNGSGAGTINITGSGSTLYVESVATLDQATVDIGSSGSAATLYADDADGQGGVLTLGPNLNLTQTGANAALADSGGAYDAILNSGTITANDSGGAFTISGSDFENDGVFKIGAGETVNIASATFVNAGTLTANGATLTLGGAFFNYGTFTTTNTQLNLGGTFTTPQLSGFLGSGDTLSFTGLLTNTGTTLNIGTGTTLGQLALTGTIEGGIVADTGNGLLTNETTYGTLSDVTYQGTLNVTGGVTIAGTFAATGAGGTGAGSIVDTGNNTEIIFKDTRTLNNLAIGLGNSTQSYLSVEDDTGNGATLTLGSGVTLTQGGQNAYLYFYQSDDQIINQGNLTAGTAGGTFDALTGQYGSFTNQGNITVSNGDQFTVAGNGTFTNLSGTTLTGGSYTVNAGSVFELANNTDIASDAATITLSGAGSAIQAYNTNTGSQTTLDSTLASIASGGALSLLSGRNFTSRANAGKFTDAGALHLGGVTFAATTLTIAGGALSGTGTVTGTVVDSGAISASTGTLQFSGAVSGAGSLGAGAGGTLDLTQGGTLSEVISGAGTLKLDGATPYTLASGAIDTIAAVTVDSGVTLSGAGTIGSAIADAGTVSATSGTLSVGGAVSGAGTLTAASGAVLDLAGGGSFSGLISGAGTLQLDGSNPFVLAAAGTLGVTSVLVDSAATLNINAGGSLAGSISGAGTLQLDGGTPYTIAAGTTLGIGTLRIDSGAGVSGTGTVSGAVIDAGNLGANTGTLAVGGAVSGAGTLYAAGGAVLNLRGGGTVSGPISGAGTLQLDGAAAFGLGAGAVSIATIAVDSGAILSSGAGTLSGTVVDAGMLSASGGVLVVSGRLSGAGALNAGNAAVIDLTIGESLTETASGAGTLQLDGGTYTVAGVVDTIAALLVDSGAVLSGYGSFAGTVTDGGAIVASGGTLSLGALSGVGSLSATASSVLDLTGGGAITGISGAGTLRLDGTTAFSLAGAAGIAAAAVDSGAALSGYGTLSGAVTNAGSITATGGTLALAGSLTGSGALAASAGAALQLSHGGTLASVSGAGALQLTGSTAYTLAGAALAIGTLTVASGATLTGTGSVAGPVTDSGTIAASGGKLVLNGAVTGAGTLQAASGAVLDLASGGTLAQMVNGAGTLEIGGATVLGATLPTVTALQVDLGHSLSGTGKLTSTIADAGTVAATTGTLTLANTLSGAGTLSAATGAVLDITKGGTLTGILGGTGTIRLDASVTLNAGAVLSVASLIETGNLALGTGESITNGAGDTYTATAASGATMNLGGATGDTVTNAGSFTANGLGAVHVSAAVINTGITTVGSGSMTFIDATTNSGTISASSGSVIFDTSVSGTGVLSIGATGTLSLLAGSAAGQAVNFIAGTGALDLTTPLHFLGQIDGFGSSDTIDLIKTAETAFSFSNGILTVSNGSTTVASLNFGGSYTQSEFSLVTDGNGGTLIKFV